MRLISYSRRRRVSRSKRRSSKCLFGFGWFLLAQKDGVSKSRADYISKMLQERGVPEENIQTVAKGGIERFSPPAVNKQCKVELIVN